jgi:hypothetical protein
MLTQLGVTDFHDRLSLLRHTAALRPTSARESDTALDDLLTRVNQMTHMMTEHVALLNDMRNHVPVNGHSHVTDKLQRLNGFDQWNSTHVPKS